MTTSERHPRTPHDDRRGWVWCAGAALGATATAAVVWGPWGAAFLVAVLTTLAWWLVRKSAPIPSTAHNAPERASTTSAAPAAMDPAGPEDHVPHATDPEHRIAEMEELRRRAERESRAKSSFLAQISHEIRMPMTGIIDMAERLLETDVGRDQKSYTRTILKSASGMLRLLDDVLDYSRGEIGELELEEREFALERAVHDAVALVFPRATAKHLALTYLIDPEVPALVEGDATRLRQILANLIGNAIKFTSEGGIHVSIGSTKGEDGKHTLRFRVQDTGPGVPQNERQSVFNPFAQVRHAAKGSRVGADLGLAISQKLIELMGGEIGLDSALGEGSTFWFTLPTHARPGEDAAADIDFGSRRVLVIDAGEASRKVVSVLSRRWVMEVAEADEGDEALRMLQDAVDADRAFDFAILDHDVPVYGGKDLAARIKAIQELKRTKLILVRNPCRPEKSSSLVRAGLDAWITKPVGAFNLRHALRHADGASREATDASYVDASFDAPARTHRVHPCEIRDIRVLLAEDNIVDQKVTSLLLKKRGCEIDVASNGREAIERLRIRRYDIVFMDCLMPLLNGFEATLSIRKLGAGWANDLPIIAMTATATSKDRALCLEAGMTDYLTKPVQSGDLERMLHKWVRGGTESETGELSMHDAHDNILDPEVVSALKELGGDEDPELFAELVGLFLDDTPRRLEDLSAALDKADASAIEQAAHALKSSAANLGAFALSELLRQIEAASKEGDLDKAAPLIRQTDREYERVESALNAEIA